MRASSDTWEWDGSKERVVLFGGGGPGGLGLYNSFNDVWEWDGARWVKRS